MILNIKIRKSKPPQLIVISCLCVCRARGCASVQDVQSPIRFQRKLDWHGSFFSKQVEDDMCHKWCVRMHMLDYVSIVGNCTV